MRSVYARFALASLILFLPIAGYPQDGDSGPAEPNRGTEPRESVEERARTREFERLDTIDIASRARALSRLSSTGTLVPDRIEDTGPDREIVLKDQAREDLWALAGELQALYDIGEASLIRPEISEEIETRSELAADSSRKLRGFVNRGLDPPPSDPVPIPHEHYDAQVLRLVTSYLSILEALAGFIDSDVLDLEKLDQVRSGLATIEALAVALPNSEYAVPFIGPPVH